MFYVSGVKVLVCEYVVVAVGLEDSSNGPMSLVTPSSPAKVTQHTGQWRIVEVDINSIAHSINW